MLIERDPVPVMFQTVPDEVAEIRRAWTEMDDAIGSLRGREFYGSFDPTTKEYRVCAVLVEGDYPAFFGLEEGTLAGGRYLRFRLEGEPPAVYDLIGPTFHRLERRLDRDPRRAQLEFYRRRGTIDLLQPLLPADITASLDAQVSGRRHPL